MVLFSLLQRCCGPQWRVVHVRLPALGTLPLNGVLAATVAGALCATWAAQYNAPWSWPLQVRGGTAQIDGPHPWHCRVCLPASSHSCYRATAVWVCASIALALADLSTMRTLPTTPCVPQDIMGVCFMLVILKQFFLPNLKVASILLCLAFVYGAHTGSCGGHQQ